MLGLYYWINIFIINTPAKPTREAIVTITDHVLSVLPIDRLKNSL